MPRFLLLSVFLLFSATGWAQLTDVAAADDKIYTFVDQMPTFRGGGTDSIIAYLGKNTSYPSAAAAQNIEGQVYISFIVASTGIVRQVHVAKSAHPLLDTAAVRVVRAMPAWQPGRQAGKPVSVRFTVPINFRLPPPTDPAASVPADAAFATFSGGPAALLTYLTTAPYPAAARFPQTPGRVFVQFEVDPTGRVQRVQAVRPTPRRQSATTSSASPVLTTDPVLLRAAEQLVATMPAWQPATEKGVAVVSLQTLPVDFYPAASPSRPPAAYAYADQLPVFAGSTAEIPFPTSLFRAIRYPPEALRQRIEGKGLLYFVVNEQGQLEQLEFIQAVHPILAQEAMRALGTQKVIVPARLSGQPVKVFYVLPLNFGIR